MLEVASRIQEEVKAKNKQTKKPLQLVKANPTNSRWREDDN